MKSIKYFLTCIFCFTFYCMNGQVESKIHNDSLFQICVQCDSLYNRICPTNSEIFSTPENYPEFPEGNNALFSFLSNHIQYPVECKENKLQGYVAIKFIINESGEIICPYIYKSLHPEADKEALRVLKLMPNWIPASKDGIPCISCFTLPIPFKYPDKP